MGDGGGDGPLSGVRVLDLSRLLPGPYATLLLHDWGAQVDKLEDPSGGGDWLRSMPELFEALNRGKRSAVLDLKSAEGQATFRKLVTRYDVLVEGFRPQVMNRLGLGYDALSKLNPHLIYCAISGYGQTGPDAQRAGHDLNYTARAGIVGYSGDEGPQPCGAQIADTAAALFAAMGVLAALYERQRTGRGRFVDVSMLESATAFMHAHLGARLRGGPPLQRGESLNGGLSTYRIYRCADGKHLSVGALEPKFQKALFEILGLTAVPAREELEAIFRERTRDEWLARFKNVDACVEPVWEGDEVLADPQLSARGMFAGQQLRTPLELGPLRPGRAPALGEHSSEILEGL